MSQLCHINQRKLEYDFIVKPGADSKKISFSFDGAGKVSIDEKGNLVLKTAIGEVVHKAPIIYQECLTSAKSGPNEVKS